MRWLSLGFVLFTVFFVVSVLVYTYYSIAFIDEYISDEQWYVSSSINVFRRVFGITLLAPYNASHVYVTVVLGEKCSIDDLVTRYHVDVAKTFEKVPGAAVIVDKDYLNLLAGDPCVVDLMPGIAPDESRINEYMNWEHPPLGKYAIGAAMAIGGVKGWIWRLPSFISSVVLHIMLILFIYRLGGKGVGAFLALGVYAAYVFLDPSLRLASALAFLDSILAFFVGLAVVLAAYRRPFLSAIAAGLAFSTKYTGLFVLIAPYAAFRGKGYSPQRALMYTLSITLAVFLAVSLPIILYLGPGGWVQELVGAIGWHTTSRPSGPPSTDPLGLISGVTPFPLRCSDGGYCYMYAYCKAPLCLLGFFAAIIFALSALKHARLELLIVSLAYLTTIGGYGAVYAAGNHTLYSFYALHFAPLALLNASLLLTAPGLSAVDRSFDAIIRILKTGFTGIFVKSAELRPISVYTSLSERRRAAVAAISAAAVFSLLLAAGNGLYPIPPACSSAVGLDLLACEVGAKTWAALSLVALLQYITYALRAPPASPGLALSMAMMLLLTYSSSAYALLAPFLILLHYYRAPFTAYMLAATVMMPSPSYAYVTRNPLYAVPVALVSATVLFLLGVRDQAFLTLSTAAGLLSSMLASRLPCSLGPLSGIALLVSPTYIPVLAEPLLRYYSEKGFTGLAVILALTLAYPVIDPGLEQAVRAVLLAVTLYGLGDCIYHWWAAGKPRQEALL